MPVVTTPVNVVIASMVGHDGQGGQTDPDTPAVPFPNRDLAGRMCLADQPGPVLMIGYRSFPPEPTDQLMAPALSPLCRPAGGTPCDITRVAPPPWRLSSRPSRSAAQVWPRPAPGRSGWRPTTSPSSAHWAEARARATASTTAAG